MSDPVQRSDHPDSDLLADGEPGEGREASRVRPDGDPGRELEPAVRTREQRRLRALREGRQSPWFGLGMFGLVGWSVTLPTLLGVAIGTWADRRWPGQISWTLTLMACGLVIGSMNAWYWINRESR